MNRLISKLLRPLLGAFCLWQTVASPIGVPIEVALSNGVPWVSFQVEPVFSSNLDQSWSYGRYYAVEFSNDLTNWFGLGGPTGPIWGVPERKYFPTAHRIEATKPPVFFRCRTAIGIPGGTLAGRNYEGGLFRKADFWCADLRDANLAGTDFRGADLRAANLHGAVLTGALLEGALLPEAADYVEDNVAEILSQELAHTIAFPAPLYERIHSDLTIIRSQFPILQTVRKNSRWIPGHVIVVAPLSVQEAWIAGSEEPRPIGFDPQGGLRFAHRYNPELLAKELATRPSVREAWAERFYGDGDNITYDPVAGIYTFLRRWGDCMAGCIDEHRWTLRVESETAILIEEAGPPLPTGE